MSESGKIRINKYLAQMGVCSRRQADELIAAGQVLVNGRTPQAGDRVDDNDEVSVNGKVISPSVKPETVVLAYNKPVGVVCSAKDQGKSHNNIVDAVGYKDRVYPIGRLDKDSEGLILLTNDGELADYIMRAANHHEKEYVVTVNQPISDVDLKKMSVGVDITLKDDVLYHTRDCRVYRVSDRSFGIILTEGKNRQIRRMCHALSYEVTRLKRIRVMHIELGDIKSGSYRRLESEETQRFWHT